MKQAEINNRLAIIKYLYIMGCEVLLTGSPISKSTCVLHFHDAVENFFILVSEIVGLSKTSQDFRSYLQQIKNKDKGHRELTHGIQLEKLNRLRKNFKHAGLLPNFEECQALKVNLSDFFNENVRKFCDVDFGKISLANSIQDEDVRKLIQEAEGLLKNRKYEGCLAKLGRAFYILFHKSQKKTKTAFGKNAVFLSPEVNLFNSGLPAKIRNQYEAFAEVLNIIILGIDYKKYAKFKCLTPRFIPMANGSINKIARINEFNTRFNINSRNVEFCYFFVIDAVLKIEKFDFGLVSAWEKPDMVSAIAENNTPIYCEKEGKLVVVKKLPQKKIIKLTGAGKSLSDRSGKKINYNKVIVDQIVEGWIESSKIIQIDNPELQKYETNQ